MAFALLASVQTSYADQIDDIIKKQTPIRDDAIAKCESLKLMGADCSRMAMNFDARRDDFDDTVILDAKAVRLNEDHDTDGITDFSITCSRAGIYVGFPASLAPYTKNERTTDIRYRFGKGEPVSSTLYVGEGSSLWVTYVFGRDDGLEFLNTLIEDGEGNFVVEVTPKVGRAMKSRFVIVNGAEAAKAALQICPTTTEFK
ncbi:hypothetical protein [Rhizobium leguminosarum]